MKISCICVTAGRVSHLNEALACFLAQTHESKQLVIYNTLPAQELVGDFPGVVIVNCAERPKSLGWARNRAALYSTYGDVFANWDDDDLYLPGFLSSFAKWFTDTVDWVYQPTQFYMENWRIVAVVKGSMNVHAFTRRAFQELGGYPYLSVGEDRELVRKLRILFRGVEIPKEGFTPQFIYGWQNRVHHLSGRGDDRPGQHGAWKRAGNNLAKQIAARRIPTGRIELVPKLRHDYAKLASDFLSNV